MGREKQTQDQYIVRMPDGLRDRLKASAQMNNRSMNAEIVARLLWALPGGGADDQIRELTEYLESARAELATADGELKTWAEWQERFEKALRAREAEVDDLRAQLDQERARSGEAFQRLYDETQRLMLLTDRRIPEGLYGRITKVAQTNERTVDEEVVQALEKAFPPPRPAAELREIAAMVENMLGKVGTAEDYRSLGDWIMKLRADADEQDREQVAPERPAT